MSLIEVLKFIKELGDKVYRWTEINVCFKHHMFVCLSMSLLICLFIYLDKMGWGCKGTTATKSKFQNKSGKISYPM